MVREQANIWRVGLYFAHRKIKNPKLTDINKETLDELSPDEKKALGVARTMLNQATIRSANEDDNEQCKVHSTKECRYAKIWAIYKKPRRIR